MNFWPFFLWWCIDDTLATAFELPGVGELPLLFVFVVNLILVAIVNNQ